MSDVISELGLQIEVLCLDREFYAKKVISFLQGAGIPFIMPVRRHSHRMKSLLEGTKSRFGTYSMKNKPSNLELNIAIVVRYFKGKGRETRVEKSWICLSWTQAEPWPY